MKNESKINYIKILVFMMGYSIPFSFILLSQALYILNGTLNFSMNDTQGPHFLLY